MTPTTKIPRGPWGRGARNLAPLADLVDAGKLDLPDVVAAATLADRLLAARDAALAEIAELVTKTETLQAGEAVVAALLAGGPTDAPGKSVRAARRRLEELRDDHGYLKAAHSQADSAVRGSFQRAVEPIRDQLRGLLEETIETARAAGVAALAELDLSDPGAVAVGAGLLGVPIAELAALGDTADQVRQAALGLHLDLERQAANATTGARAAAAALGIDDFCGVGLGIEGPSPRLLPKTPTSGYRQADWRWNPRGSSLERLVRAVVLADVDEPQAVAATV